MLVIYMLLEKCFMQDKTILFKHNNWEEILKLEHACNLIVFKMHIFIVLIDKMVPYQTIAMMTLLVFANWFKHKKHAISIASLRTIIKLEQRRI